MKTSLNSVLSLGLYGRLIRRKETPQIGNIVAAGNPEKCSFVSDNECDFLQDFTFMGVRYKLEDYLCYKVSGDSMSPKGIYNGDSLLVDKIKNTPDINCNDLIVIEVDHEFYKTRHGDYRRQHEYKLRQALTPIMPNMTEEEVCRKIALTYDEYLIPNYKTRLINNLREARNFYQNKSLYASVTYPDGKMHISFHAQSLIQGKVVVIGRKKGSQIEYINPENL